MTSRTVLRQKFAAIWPLLDERTRRIMAANDAMSLGDGGISRVRRACGLSRKAIANGMQEIKDGSSQSGGRIRRAGAGRKKITASDPHLLAALERVIDPGTRGDPESPVRWICTSTRTLAAPLSTQNHPVSDVTIAPLLHDQHDSLQRNRKTEEGGDHPERDAPFRHINTPVKTSMAEGLPVMSVDTQKKERLGHDAHGGQQWLPATQPLQVNGHDFPDPDVPRAFPYGVYDLGYHTGFVTVGTDHDPAACAVASIRGWWRVDGRHWYPNAQGVVITADGGGSNGSRLRLWKLELQQWANEMGRGLSVCHFPPGTSKGNTIEPRLFSFISSNWRGEPLRNDETIVSVIAKTTTAKGLPVTCRLDRRKYPTGRTVSDAEMRRVNMKANRLHGNWNYVIRPNPKKVS